MKNHMRALLIIVGLLVASVSMPAAAACNSTDYFGFYTCKQDGVTHIEAVGTLPTHKDSQYPDGQPDKYDITDHPGIQSSCFQDYQSPTFNFTLIGSPTTWGDGGNDVVEIGGRSAQEFGFEPSSNFTDPKDGSTVSCQKVQKQWGKYSKPKNGQFFITATLTVNAGTSGTEVKIDDGFDMTFLGSGLDVNGKSNKPVTFRGNRWNGLNLLSGTAATLDHCVLRNSSAPAAIQVHDVSTLDVSSCEFNSNNGGSGAAISAPDSGAKIRIVDSTFKKNSGNKGGALYLKGAIGFGSVPGLVIRNFRFEGNEAVRGGAIYLSQDTDARLENVTMVDNKAGRGGGLLIAAGSAKLWNPVVVGNTGRLEGGGIRVSADDAVGAIPAKVTLYNPTVAFNEATTGGGIMNAYALDTVDIRNGIVWGNILRDGTNPSPSGPQVGSPNGGTIYFRKVMMQGGLSGGYAGSVAPAVTDLVMGTPSFRSEPDSAGQGNGSPQADFHLTSDSQAINRGTDSLYDATGFQNIGRDGNPRVFPGEKPKIDLGAYEFPNNPPTLLSTGTIDRSVDEKDSPIPLTLCGSYQDSDIHPDYPNSTVLPWLTHAPGGNSLASTSSVAPYGNVLADSGGSPGDTVHADNSLGSPQGNVYYDPANRSRSYSVSIECRAYDQLIDAQGNTNSTLSMFSRARQTAIVHVNAVNDPPQFQGQFSTRANAGSQYDSKVKVTDPDVDQPPRSLRASIVSGPSWIGITRPDADHVELTGVPGSSGDVDVKVKLVDPDGGTQIQQITISVKQQTSASVDAGPDQSGEPGDQILLSATGPDQSGLTYQWQILDSNGSQVATQYGQNYTWTAQAGVFTAKVNLAQASTVVDSDTLTLTIQNGFDGTTTNPSNRTPPTSTQQALIDGTSSSGSTANQQTWNSLSSSQQAADLAAIAQTDLTPQQQDAVLAAAAQLADSATAPIGSGVAADIAAAYGGLAGLPLTSDRRDAVLSGVAKVRQRAANENALSSALTSAEVTVAAGLFASDSKLTDAQAQKTLSALTGDLAMAVEKGVTLDGSHTNLALAALKGAVNRDPLTSAVIDQITSSLRAVTDQSGAPSAPRWSLALDIAAKELSAKGITEQKRKAVLQAVDQIVSSAVASGFDVNSTGSPLLQVATRSVAPGGTGPIKVGLDTPAGPLLTIPRSAVDELRQRNAVPSTDPIAFTLIGTRSTKDASEVVRIAALDASGSPLTDTSLNNDVKLRLPLDSKAATTPVSTGAAPATTTNTQVTAKAVEFDTDQFSSFTLTSAIDSGSGRSNHSKSSCFLDSLL